MLSFSSIEIVTAIENARVCANACQLLNSCTSFDWRVWMEAANPVQPAVRCEQKDAVLILTLNRPEKSNSLHPEMVAQLSEAIKKAEGDPGVMVVVITGAGRSFCAGLDLELLL